MEEIDLMDIAYRIIPILREEKLTYNQAKEVLECCGFLLGDECRMLCEESRVIQKTGNGITKKPGTEFHESTETFGTNR